MDNHEAAVALTGILLKAESDLGLPNRFVLDLVQQDDWSFTIKAHALLEAAVTQVLRSAITDRRLHPLISSLNLAGRHSKLSYAEALGLLEDGHVRFLNQLSQIRNTIVHNIAHVSFTFEAYLNSLDSNKRQSTLQNLLFMGGNVPSNLAAFLKQAKIVLWAHMVAVLGHCQAQQAEARSRTAIEEQRQALADDLLKGLGWRR